MIILGKPCDTSEVLGYGRNYEKFVKRYRGFKVFIRRECIKPTESIFKLCMFPVRTWSNPGSHTESERLETCGVTLCEGPEYGYHHWLLKPELTLVRKA